MIAFFDEIFDPMVARDILSPPAAWARWRARAFSEANIDPREMGVA
jgi:hypothetical protein